MEIKENRQNNHIRKGDIVFIRSGNDRGLKGEVLSRTDTRVVVKGVNVRKKHEKRSQLNPQGGVVSVEMSIHISNVSLIGENEKPVRAKSKKNANGEKILYYVQAGKEVTLRSVNSKN